MLVHCMLITQGSILSLTLPQQLTGTQPCPQMSLASFEVTSPAKLVGRTRLGHEEQGQVSNFSQKNGNHISFLPSTMILKTYSEGMYVYSLILKPKAGFRQVMSGTFSRWTGTFFTILCQRELAWGQG